jgi:hypothetical protein
MAAPVEAAYLAQRETPESQHNIEVWVNSATIQDARPHLKKVCDPSQCLKTLNELVEHRLPIHRCLQCEARGRPR